MNITTIVYLFSPVNKPIHFSQTFTNWYQGEPNDSGHGVRLWTDKDYTWDDNAETNRWSYVCEKQSIGNS